MYGKPKKGMKPRQYGKLQGGRNKLKYYEDIAFRMKMIEIGNKPKDKMEFLENDLDDDYYYPISKLELEEKLQEITQGMPYFITNVWFRKRTGQCKYNIALYNKQGVRLLIINSIRNSNKIYIGIKKPTARWTEFYKQWDEKAEIFEDHEKWYVQFSDKGVKNYYLNYILGKDLAQMIAFEKIRAESGDKSHNDYLMVRGPASTETIVL
ncbi:MAG: hypothetical protein V3575_00310 [Candidatus Absconditabacteria bacterium]